MVYKQYTITKYESNGSFIKRDFNYQGFDAKVLSTNKTSEIKDFIDSRTLLDIIEDQYKLCLADEYIDDTVRLSYSFYTKNNCYEALNILHNIPIYRIRDKGTQKYLNSLYSHIIRLLSQNMDPYIY